MDAVSLMYEMTFQESICHMTGGPSLPMPSQLIPPSILFHLHSLSFPSLPFPSHLILYHFSSLYSIPFPVLCPQGKG